MAKCRIIGGKQVCQGPRTNWWKDAMGIDWYSPGPAPEPEPDPGLVWLQQNAYVFQDYTTLQGAIGEAVQASDTGLDDVGPNAIDSAPLNGILVNNYLLNDKPLSCVRDTSDDCLSITIADILPELRQDIELSITLQTEDGQVTGGFQLFGAITNNTSGSRQKFNAFIQANGTLGIQMAVGGGQISWTSTSAVLADGVSTPIELRIRYDFTNDTLTVIRYDIATSTESAVTGSFAVGGDSIDISGIDPTALNLTHNFLIGSTNNIGTVLSNTNTVRIFRFAITSLNPPAEVITYLRNLDIDALWESQFHVTSANYATTRTTIRDAIFGAGNYPTNATPTSTAAVTTGTIHGIDVSTLTGWDTITRLIFDRDGASHRVYRIVNSAPNGEVMFYSFGHSPINDALAVQTYLDNGLDVMLCAMATTGEPEDLSDNTASVTWTPSVVNNHDEMEPLGVGALQYFLFDKIEAKNYLKANFSYTNIYMSGTSGGGWTTVLLCALDEDFEKGFPIRGFRPRIYKCPPDSVSSDLEQGGTNGTWVGLGNGFEAVYDFFTEHTFEDMVALGCTNGRLVKTITHTGDTAGLGGTTFNTWLSKIQTLAGQLGGQYKLFLNDAVGEDAHSVYADELAEIIVEL